MTPVPDRSARVDSRGRTYLAPIEPKRSAEFEQLIDRYDQGVPMPLLSACMGGEGVLLKGWRESVVDESWRPDWDKLVGKARWY
jgi:hypothetical protein